MEKFQDNTSSAPQLILLGVVALAFMLMLWASFGDSAIMDELAHIPAGYGYVNNLDYRLNPEHPPFIKALAGFPLAFLNLYFPFDNPSWTKEVNGQWAMGSDFLYGSGNDADYVVRSARILPMILALVLIVLIYAWASELLGVWWGLLPAILFGLSPIVLAHGHYVTTDIGATFGIILAAYYFIKFLRSPTPWRLFAAGLAFGVAQLMKFSAVLLIPYFIILMAFFYLFTTRRDWHETFTANRKHRFLKRAWNYSKSLLAIFAIGYLVIVYPVYALFTKNYPMQKQASDTEFILNSFAGGPTPPGQFCAPARCLADFDIWLAKNAVTRPFAEYLLGVMMVVQRSAGGNTNYFLGEVSAAGSPAYFPTVYALKETLPALIIVLLGLLYALRGIAVKLKNGLKKTWGHFVSDYLGSSFAEFSMLIFIIFYWIYSIGSPLNIGVRHLLPTIPFIYILAASAWKKWFDSSAAYEKDSPWLKMKSNLETFLKGGIVFVLAFWFLAETALAAPYFLSYFNKFGGGVYGGYKFVTDSNYDWGQDLLRLRDFAIQNGVDKIAVDYFGGGNPKYYLEMKEVDWQSSKGNPAYKGIYWLAVSINTLQNAVQPLAPGQSRNPDDEYGWLTSYRPPQPDMGNVPAPDFRIGTSIFVYRL